MGLGYVAGAGHSAEIDAISAYVKQASGSAASAASSASAASGSASSAKNYSDAAAASAANAKNAVKDSLGGYYTKTEMQNGYYTKEQIDTMMNGVKYPDGKLVFSKVSKQSSDVIMTFPDVTVPSTVDYVEVAGVKIARGGSAHIEFTFYAVNYGTNATARGTATFASSGTVSFSMGEGNSPGNGASITVNGYHYV